MTANKRDVTVKDATRKQYRDQRQCRSCKHDDGPTCAIIQNQITQLATSVREWCEDKRWRGNYPTVFADDCPGWELRPGLERKK